MLQGSEKTVCGLQLPSIVLSHQSTLSVGHSSQPEVEWDGWACEGSGAAWLLCPQTPDQPGKLFSPGWGGKDLAVFIGKFLSLSGTDVTCSVHRADSWVLEFRISRGIVQYVIVCLPAHESCALSDLAFKSPLGLTY